MGSAQSARGIQPGGVVVPVGRASSSREGGRRPAPGHTAAVGRISSAAVRRDRPRFGLEGSGGEGGSRAPARELYSALPPRLRRLPRGRGEYLRAFPPLRGFRGTGPLRLPRVSSTGPDCPQSASNRAARPGRGPASDQKGARGPRRCRLPTRPVLKHGPRSLTRARVKGPS